MPELPWQTIEEENKRLREVPWMGQTYYVRPENMLTDYVPQEGLENIPFTKAIKIMGHCDLKVRGYCLRPGKPVGNAAMAPKGQWG